MLIGEALLELMFVSNENLLAGLKLQNWISELIEKSVFIDGIINTESLKTGFDLNLNQSSMNFELGVEHNRMKKFFLECSRKCSAHPVPAGSGRRGDGPCACW